MSRFFPGNRSIFTPHHASMAVQPPMAIGLWFRCPFQGGFKYLISKLLVAGNHPSWGFNTNGSGEIRMLIGYGTGGADFYQTPGLGGFSDNNWHYMLGTYNGAELVLYMDGTPLTNLVATLPIAYDATKSLYLGSFDSTQLYYNGDIAELTVWSAIPSAGDRAALAKGIDPLLIRTSAINLHMPLRGRANPEQELFNGIPFTVEAGMLTGAHPRILSARQPQVPSLIAATPPVTSNNNRFFAFL